MAKTLTHLPAIESPTPIDQQALTRSRISCLREFPHLSFMVMGTEQVFTTDPAIKTAAAFCGNINRVYWRIEWFATLSLYECNFVLLHEILHIHLRHTERAYLMDDLQAELWGLAADLAINWILVNLGSKKLVMPEHGLYSERFAGMSAEAIYQWLLDQVQAQPGHTSGNAIGKAIKMAKKMGKGDQLDQLIKSHPTDELKVQNDHRVAAAAQEARKFGSETMGEGALALLRLFDALLVSVVPWTELVDEYLVTIVDDGHSYRRANRRNTEDIIFPTRDGRHINVLFGCDTSGSMSEADLNEATSELKGLLDAFDSWTLTMLSCDTVAHVLGTYYSTEGDDFSTINLNMLGGGGTDMAPMIEYGNALVEAGDESAPSVMIIFTDGHVPSYDDVIGDTPVLTIVTSKGNASLTLDNSEVIQMHEVAA